MNIDAILTALLIPFAGTALGSAFLKSWYHRLCTWLRADDGTGCRNGVDKQDVKQKDGPCGLLTGVIEFTQQ